eukprot:jgi/Psemu1/318017/estExt_fgenesh1_pm.C_410009
MSVVGNNRVGIPIVVLHDAEGAVVEIETKAGELIRGLLFEAEDQMNLYIKNAIIRDVNGVKRKSPQVYVRGTEIVFIILPDMLKHAPMFNRIKHWRKHGGAPPEGVGQAVGQAAAIIRKAEDRRRGGFGGRFGGRGGRDGGRGGRGGFGGGRGGGGRGDFGGRGGPPQRSFGQRPQGQYGPR